MPTTDLNRHSKISWNIAWRHKEFRKSFLQLVQLSSIYTPTICQIAFAPFQEITTESLNFIKAPYYLPFPYLLVLPKPIYPGSQLVFWSFHSIHHFFFFSNLVVSLNFYFFPNLTHLFIHSPFFLMRTLAWNCGAFAKHQSDYVFLSEALKSAFANFDWACVIIWGFNCLLN